MSPGNNEAIISINSDTIVSKHASRILEPFNRAMVNVVAGKLYGSLDGSFMEDRINI